MLTVPHSNVTFNLFTFFALLKNTSFLCGIKSLTNLQNDQGIKDFTIVGLNSKEDKAYNIEYKLVAFDYGATIWSQMMVYGFKQKEGMYLVQYGG